MPSGARDLAHLRQMRYELGAGLVDGLDRGARKLELAARLERDRAAAGRVEQADDVAVLDDRLPAEQVKHAFEQCADAARAPHRAPARRPSSVKANFSCSVPMRKRDFGLAPCEPRDQLVARLDRRHVDLVTGHAGFRRNGRRPYTDAPRKSNEALVMPAVAPARRPRI